MESLAFSPIVETDVPTLTGVMTRAFDDEARRHLGKERGGPPGYDDGGFFRTWLFGQKVTRGHKIALSGVVIGGTIVWVFPHGRNVLGVIFVDPAYQNRGIGTTLWQLVERTYPAKSWRLETPGWAAKNHFFYGTKCGFTKAGTRPDTGPLGEKWEMFVYKKMMSPAGRKK